MIGDVMFLNKIMTAKQGFVHLFSVGQAGYIIKSKNGKLLGIDLYLSNCVERLEGNIGYKRLLPQLLSPDDISFDYLIATHPHYDHFDIDSIPILMKNHKSKLFASVNCKKEIDNLDMNMDNVQLVSSGDYYSDKDICIHFVNCDHGQSAPDAFGVIIEIDGLRILAVGDTSLRLDYVDEYLKYGKIDIMLAAINGAYGNLNEKECAILSKAVNPVLTIPCHYGMFADHGGNPGEFLKYMSEICPNNRLLLMAQGEGIQL